jgi:MFS family permease
MAHAAHITESTNSETARIEDRNYFHLLIEVAWFGLALTATARFLSVFAIRLGASPMEQGLLQGLQGLTMGLATFAVVHWRNRFRTTLQAINLPGIFFRFWFLLPVFTPLFPADWQIPWLLFSVAFTGMAQGVVGPLFSVHMRESVSSARLNALSSRRFAAMNIGLGITSVAFGWLLTHLPFPLNYQVMFGGAFVMGMISHWHVMQSRTLYPVDSAPADQPADTPRVPVWRLKGWGVVIAASLLTHLAFLSVNAIIPMVLVSEMKADEAYMGVFGLLELLGGITAGLTGEWFLRRLSPRRLTGLAVGMTAAAPLFVALAPSLTVALGGAMLNGLGWTLVAIGLYAVLVERTPSHAMPQATMIYHQMLALGMFVGPLIGSSLAGWGLDLTWVLLIGVGLRLAAGLVLGITRADLVAVLRPRRAAPQVL